MKIYTGHFSGLLFVIVFLGVLLGSKGSGVFSGKDSRPL